MRSPTFHESWLTDPHSRPQVPKLASAIGEMSGKNPPKLIRDKRAYITAYYKQALGDRKFDSYKGK